MAPSRKNNQELLIESAIEVFGKHGYVGAGVQEIVAGAGLKKPTLYYHFGSKEGLWDAVIDYLIGDFEEFFAGRFKRGRTFAASVNRLLDIIENYDREYPSRFRVLFLFALTGSEEQNRTRHEKYSNSKGHPIVQVFEQAGYRPAGPRFLLTSALLQAFIFNLATGLGDFRDRKQLQESIRAIESLDK